MKLFDFLKDVVKEADKISWPTGVELTSSIVAVFIFVFVFTMYFICVDYCIFGVFSKIIGV